MTDKELLDKSFNIWMRLYALGHPDEKDWVENILAEEALREKE